jgi:hypothetical protein
MVSLRPKKEVACPKKEMWLCNAGSAESDNLACHLFGLCVQLRLQLAVARSSSNSSCYIYVCECKMSGLEQECPNRLPPWASRTTSESLQPLREVLWPHPSHLPHPLLIQAVLVILTAPVLDKPYFIAYITLCRLYQLYGSTQHHRTTSRVLTCCHMYCLRIHPALPPRICVTLDILQSKISAQARTIFINTNIRSRRPPLDVPSQFLHCQYPAQARVVNVVIQQKILQSLTTPRLSCSLVLVSTYFNKLSCIYLEQCMNDMLLKRRLVLSTYQ